MLNPVATSMFYQLKVTLRESDPPIWRRIIVPSDLTLEELHAVLQISMGWENDHMHAFIAGKIQYGERGMLDGAKDECKARLNDVFAKVGSRIVYEYDFGDNWVHDVVLEDKLPADDKQQIVCLDGQRSCPPEDCGGVWGYENLLEALSDKKHPEHKQLREWLGGPFNPERFDAKAVTKRLKRVSSAQCLGL